MKSNYSQFRKGQSGNPKGRPKGSRNKLTQKFLADIEKDWKMHGKEVLEYIRESFPEVYLRVVAGLINKENPEVSHDEPIMMIKDAREELFEKLQRRFPIHGNEENASKETDSRRASE